MSTDTPHTKEESLLKTLLSDLQKLDNKKGATIFIDNIQCLIDSKQHEDRLYLPYPLTKKVYKIISKYGKIEVFEHRIFANKGTCEFVYYNTILYFDNK